MQSRPLRWFFIALALFFMLNISDFISHFRFYFSSDLIDWTITGNWVLVFASSAFFLLFIFLLRYRKKADWKGRGIFAAFIISMFIEMYGFPLTVYLTSNHLFRGISYPHDIGFNWSIFGFEFGISRTIIYGSVLILIGTLFIIKGWYDLYTGSKASGLVTTGIYKHSRHPQYLGMILVVVGWVIVWPTILTLIMGSIMATVYTRLSIREEDENKSREYSAYAESTPFFI